MSEILIVEDDPAVRSILVFLLQPKGYSLSEAASAGEARLKVRNRTPDLVLLDRVLPDGDGLDLLREWRREARTDVLPIILLTARDAEADRIEGLSAGADDYVSKPFSAGELVLRIAKLLRREPPDRDRKTLRIKGLSIDRSSVRVAIENELLHLSAIEFRLIDLLASNAERVHTRGEIIDKVWTSSHYVDPRTVDVHIRRLRRILEPYGYDRFIQTVRGIGYRFSSEFV